MTEAVPPHMRRDATKRVPTRTEATTAHYRREGRRVVKDVCGDAHIDAAEPLLTAAAAFAAADGRWSASTIRAKRAGLRQLAADLAEEGRMTMHDLAELEQRLAQGPDPCASDAPAHTSGLKRKRLPHAECERLVVHLLSGHTRTQRLLAGIVALSAILPMRPCEWATASVVRGSLRIVCAKCTNGRGIARMRLVELDETLAKAASNTVRAFRKQLSEAGSLRRFHARLSKALTRACVEAKIAPICLYTLRHQALATAKRFFPAEVVAALAGHASVVTATRVYAKRRGGWSVKPSISVSPRLVARVRTPEGASFKARAQPRPP